VSGTLRLIEPNVRSLKVSNIERSILLTFSERMLSQTNVGFHPTLSYRSLSATKIKTPFSSLKNEINNIAIYVF